MKKTPNILYYDVETSPVLAWIWRTGTKINIGHDQIRKGQKFDIICICYKWAGESKIHSLDWGLRKQDSTDMIETFSKIIAKADIVVGHNGDSFDQRQVNTQRLLHDQEPLNWPTSEDTLKQFRKYFYFPSYKLDYLSKTLIGSGKDPMCFQDWIDIVEGKESKALAKMIKYCKKDVQRLNQIFDKASKFFEAKAHRGIICGGSRDSCPHCGYNKSTKSGFKVTRVGKYQRYTCSKCAHVWRDGRMAKI